MRELKWRLLPCGIGTKRACLPIILRSNSRKSPRSCFTELSRRQRLESFEREYFASWLLAQADGLDHATDRSVIPSRIGAVLLVVTFSTRFCGVNRPMDFTHRAMLTAWARPLKVAMSNAPPATGAASNSMIFIKKIPDYPASLLLGMQPELGANCVLFTQHIVENSISSL
jgi:hypothetical protein